MTGVRIACPPISLVKIKVFIPCLEAYIVAANPADAPPIIIISYIVVIGQLMD